MVSSAIRLAGGFGLVLALAIPGFAQERNPESAREAVRDGFRRSGLEEGDDFPDVAIFDAEGQPFRTRELRGSYSVLVTGCLT